MLTAIKLGVILMLFTGIYFMILKTVEVLTKASQQVEEVIKDIKKG
jgi:Na+-translocating ferredoxin:NAD+ oxidoreductase RnfG subunit